MSTHFYIDKAIGTVVNPLGDPMRFWSIPTEALEESNLVKHALNEMKLLGEDKETTEWMVAMVYLFSTFGHSGASAQILTEQLNMLLKYKALTPITDDPSEWLDVGLNTWQNRRDSSLFSGDGGKTYTSIDDRNNELRASARHK